MKKILFFLLFLIGGCVSFEMPSEFAYHETKTGGFEIISWQKINRPQQTYKIYIEGDGHAFNAKGHPTNDPTPKSSFMRELATNDKNSNVIYLARPCQYVKSERCEQKFWTTARFAPEVVEAEYQTIKKIVHNNPIILIGYSGGAQVAGLIAATKPDLNIKKIITVAGNLDHRAWVEHHHLVPLNGSLSLTDYYTDFINIPQIHYVGEKDKVILPELTQQFIKNNALVVIVPKATHDKGWESIFQKIWSEN